MRAAYGPGSGSGESGLLGDNFSNVARDEELVIVRKHTVTEDRLVEADLRRERVEVEADPEIADRVTHEEPGSWGSRTGDDAGAPATTIQGGTA